MDRGDDRMTGWCGLGFLPKLNETEVAYMLDKDYWNRGYATKAARISLGYGFK